MSACTECGGLGLSDEAGDCVESRVRGDADHDCGDCIDLLTVIDILRAERDAAVRRLDALTRPAERERREHAKACHVALIIAYPHCDDGVTALAHDALLHADALIAALDAPVKL